MADYTPVFATGGAPITLQASATVTGGRLLEVTGNGTVGPAGAASTKAIGIAAYDAASGTKVDVWPLPGEVHEVVASGAIAAGDGLIAGAAGVVSTIGAGTFQQLLGVALAAAADTATCRFIGR
jgi:Uncharacterized conserved protein (DUF2190)